MVSDGTNFASFIRENFITVSLVPPKAPENVVVDVVDNNVELSWSEVTTSILDTPIVVDYYLIYAANEPLGNFMYIGYTATNSFTHPGVALFVDKMFYKVQAYFGTREYLDTFTGNKLKLVKD
jgi:fibronectin type 3 domain-containing protein